MPQSKTFKFGAFAFTYCLCALLGMKSSVAYDDSECFGTVDGAPSPTVTLSLVNSVDDQVDYESVLDVSEMLYNLPTSTSTVLDPDGIIKCTGTTNCNLIESNKSVDKIDRAVLGDQLSQYTKGEEWSVYFEGKGVVRGLAICGPNGWASSTSAKTGRLTSAYNACLCTITDFWDEDIPINDFRYMASNIGSSGSNWIEKTNYCRQNCPKQCASVVATNATFRSKLFTTCPVFEQLLSCGPGEYSPDGETCTDVGAHYWSPMDDNDRYECDDGLTTAGYGIGADEAGDCGKILHIGDYSLHLSSDKRVFGTPVLHVRIGDYMYYANMTTDETPMNDNTDKTLRVKYNNTTQYIYDITME